MSKKRLIITSTISIVLVAILLIGSTYSVFTTTEIDENSNIYKTGSLDVTYTLSKNNIQITNETPMTAEEAKIVTPYHITVTNTGTVPYMFDVILTDTTASDPIDNQYIMTKVGYLKPKKLSDCIDNIIKEDIILPAGKSVDIDVRVWLDSTLPNSEIGNSFYAKLIIDGLAIYNDDTDISNNSLSLAYMKNLFTNNEEENNYSYFKNDAYREKIKNVSFVNYLETDTSKIIEYWDVSEKDNNRIIAWLEKNEEEGFFDLYIGHKEVIYAKNLSNIFSGMTALEQIDFSNLNTSLTTDMSYMFQYCTNIKNLDISSFNTSNVTNMSNMFYGCENLTTLDLSNFNTIQVINMDNMFSHAYNLTTSLTIENNYETTYKNIFTNAALSEQASIIINYTNKTSTLVDEMILTKSDNSNVKKGTRVS